MVSGAAFGIDQAAHRGALAGGGPTVAVLACGVDRAYPVGPPSRFSTTSPSTARSSPSSPPGCSPTRLRFLSRNRLIAGLSLGTVVVEAAVRSGALNTAHWTERLSRPLMGVPGPVTSAPSQGVHELLRTGASLVTRGADVAELVGLVGEHLVADERGETRVRDGLRPREAQVLDAVPVHRPAAADSVSRTAGIGLVEVQRVLGRLHGLGLVERADTGWRLAPAAR